MYIGISLLPYLFFLSDVFLGCSFQTVQGLFSYSRCLWTRLRQWDAWANEFNFAQDIYWKTTNWCSFNLSRYSKFSINQPRLDEHEIVFQCETGKKSFFFGGGGDMLVLFNIWSVLLKYCFQGLWKNMLQVISALPSGNIILRWLT